MADDWEAHNVHGMPVSLKVTDQRNSGADDRELHDVLKMPVSMKVTNKRG